jgi:predicted  nucleic acid-binding Zn-ribbon protein
MSFLSFDEVQPRIKDIHQNYQTDIVTDLSKISLETSRIIKNLTDIEGEIATYQSQIDGWSTKIGQMTEECESMQYLQGMFEKKLENLDKLSK